MEEEKYQKELFEFDKPKRTLPRLSDFFPKADFERNVILTLTLDRAVFIAIGILMIMVVIYALGVETGRARSASDVEVPPQAAIEVKAPQVIPAAPIAVPVVKIVKAPVPQPVLAVKAQSVALNTVAANSIKKTVAPVVVGVSKPYTIVAVTFTRRDTAMLELDKLRKQGYTATIMPSNRYFLVCIGAYPDKTGTQAQKDLKKIKRMYKDAYIKLR